MEALNDGMVKIYRVVNVAEPGEKPVSEIILKKKFRYKRKRVGIQRYYSALQANAEVKYVLRVPYDANISTQDVAIPNDGYQYSIRQVQEVEDSFPRLMDLTLVSVEQKYKMRGDGCA